MAYRAGQAFIQVVPSFSGFQLAAAQQAKNLRAIKIPVEYDFKDLPTELPKQKPVKIPVDLDQGSFDRNVKAKLEAAMRSLPKAQIGASATEAEQKIKDLRAELAALGDKKIGVDISDEEVLAEIERLHAELTRLGAESPSIRVKADVAAAAAELEAVQKIASRLDGDTVNVPVDADTGAAESKLTALDGRLKSMSARSWLIRVGISALPMAGPLAAVLGGATGGIAALGAGLLAGVAGGAAIGIASIKQATDLQKQLTTASKARATALAGVKSAEASLATAVNSSATAQIAAERGVQDAETSLANARRSGSQAIAQAEQSLADDRRNAARVAVQSEQQITAAETALKTSQDQVKASLDNLHDAREQAKRDLEDLKEATTDDANNQESAAIQLIDAQNALAALQASGTASALDLRKANLAVAEAQDAVSDATRQATRDAQDLQKVQKDGDPGVNSAQAQLTAAQKAAAAAATALAQAKKDAAQARGDAARSVSRAEQQLAETRANAARSVAAAELALSRARSDGARQQAQAQAQVAVAQARVAAAQDKLDTADTKRQKILDSMMPSQKRLIAGIAVLKADWHGFLDTLDKPIAGAALAGMSALEKILPGLALFLRPVFNAFRDIFNLFGNAAGTKGFKTFAADFGKFSSGVLRDAAVGTLNLAKGFGNLLRAFMPLSTDMSKGLLGLTQRFANWSDGLGKDKGFASFIAYVRKEGPVVEAVLGSIIVVAAKLLKGLAPLGGAMLKGLELVFGFLAKLSPGQLLAVAGAVVGLFLALKVGLIAVKVATLEEAGALDILNIALDANPIGIIVLAIAALAAGLIYAFTHVKWFHDGVVAVFTFLKNNWPLLLPILLGPIGALIGAFVEAYKTSGTFRDIVTGALSTVQSAAGAVVDWFNRDFVPFFTTTIPNAFGATVDWVTKHWPLILAIITGPIGLATLYIVNHWSTITGAFTDAKNWVVDKFSTAWGAVQAVVTAPIRGAENVISGIFGKGGTLRDVFNAVKDWVTGAFSDEWAGIKAIFTNPVQAAKNVFNDLLGPKGTIRGIFSAAVDALGSIWDGLRALFAKPVNWIIDNVINKLISAVNSVSNHLGGGDLLKPFKDVSTGVVKKTSSGGAPSAVTGHAAGGVLPGYTPGRDVHLFTSPTAGSLALSGGEAIMVPEWTRAVGGAAAVKRMNAAARYGHAAYASGGIADRLPGAQSFARSQVGKPYIWGGVGPDGYDCSGFMSALTNYLRGQPINNRVGATASFPWSGFLPGPGLFTIGSSPNYRGDGVGHMAGTLGGLNVESRGGQGVIVGPGARGYNDSGFTRIAHLGPGGDFGGGGGGAGGGSAPTIGGLIGGALSSISNLLGKVPGGPIGMALAKGTFNTLSGLAKSKVGDLIKDLWKFSPVGAAAGAVSGLIGKVFGDSGTGSVEKIVQGIAGGYGWGTGSEWASLSNIISHESGWNPKAQNPSSTAYGLFQFLNGTWAGTGIDKTSDPSQQSVAGMRYIKNRYGDPNAAWRYWQAHDSYAGGGVLGMFDAGGMATGAGFLRKQTIEPERVLSPQQTRAFEALAASLARPSTMATGVATGRGMSVGLADEDRALMRQVVGLADRPVSVKIGQRQVAESVQDYRNDRRLHGEPGWT